MNPEMVNRPLAVDILYWLLGLAEYHPIQFSVVCGLLALTVVVGLASLVVEPLSLIHNHLEAVDAEKPKPSSRQRKKLPPPPPPSRWRKLLAATVHFLSAVARNPA